ncbi:AbfB domain-containing protein [Streptomyces sp. NPDC093970]|uniref:AbfB domain-containing protein n=1 Tax=Streptomyces sp. NPDC093970 TaxID=3155076 RepID=UPI0034410B95
MRKPVPGLADSGGVSFGSVNCPARHPCHHGHRLSPDENDDATPSAQDTTFHRTAGPAGPADPARSRRLRPVPPTPPGPRSAQLPDAPHPPPRPTAAPRPRRHERGARRRHVPPRLLTTRRVRRARHAEAAPKCPRMVLCRRT